MKWVLGINLEYPKIIPISNITRNMNDSMVIMRQSRHNKIGLFWYTSQLEPKNVEETGGDEYWTTAL